MRYQSNLATWMRYRLKIIVIGPGQFSTVSILLCLVIFFALQALLPPIHVKAIEPPPSQIFLPIVTKDDWRMVNIPLYGMKLILPTDWLIFEINRRPEPGVPISGHDCADYLISSPDGKSVLTLYPTCGFSEGFPVPLPADAVVVKTIDASHWIIRYKDNVANSVLYSSAGLATISDSTGTHQVPVRSDPPVISVGILNTLTFIRIEARYSSSGTIPALTQEQFDRIVLSIEK